MYSLFPLLLFSLSLELLTDFFDSVSSSSAPSRRSATATTTSTSPWPRAPAACTRPRSSRGSATSCTATSSTRGASSSTRRSSEAAAKVREGWSFFALRGVVSSLSSSIAGACAEQKSGFFRCGRRRLGDLGSVACDVVGQLVVTCTP